MLLKNCVYIVVILLCLFSVVSLIFSVVNKNKNICKNIILIDGLYIVYLVMDLCMPTILNLPVGLEILIIYLFVFISIILYIISIVLNLIKMRKLKVYSKKKKVTIITIILIVLPILFLSTNVLKNKYLVNNSNLILVYHSDGNGGFDGEDFAYAIGDNFCRQFDLGIDFNGYKLERFLPKNVVEINNISDIKDYQINLDDDGILVYKNKKYVCKKKHKSNYFNIEFKVAFYINH